LFQLSKQVNLFYELVKYSAGQHPGYFVLFTKPVSFIFFSSMSITIKDIARDLKLAVSTVSKALRNSYEISDETKRVVLEYARKVNYIPNPYAGSLTHRTTRNIAVVLPEVADTYFSNAINGIDAVAHARGYHVIVYLTHEDTKREEAILKELRGGRVDAVLISVAGAIDRNTTIHKELAAKMPLIFFDRVCDDVETGKVLTDDFNSSYAATAHLLSKGCKEIVMIAPDGSLSIIEARKEGFRCALHDHGVPWDHHFFLACSENQQACRSSIRDLLQREKSVDGIVASVEKLAIHVYDISRELGIVIPDRLKIIAFSNLQIASLLAPSLSTIEQPAYEMGQIAATLVFKALARKIDLKYERITIPSVLRERESTRA
jgi:LacI family transcriptional regulator